MTTFWDVYPKVKHVTFRNGGPILLIPTEGTFTYLTVAASTLVESILTVEAILQWKQFMHERSHDFVSIKSKLALLCFFIICSIYE